ncbi:hypothetical protein IPM09_01565 [Candidatus Saccharibacteria bacterium]|nr:MAG: hypothetical protein IPM09_01565 [Candidatus Saccharibacteria bacterium]
MCAIGATITASSLNGNRVDANQLAIVSATETTKSDTVSLTTLKLSDGMIVTCKPTQAACQSASPGDIIVYTKYLHSSGFFVERSEVTFVTPGPASKR